MSAWDSIITVIGTLGGLLVGYWISLQMETRRQKHERKEEYRKEIKKHMDDIIKPLFVHLQNLWGSLGILHESMRHDSSLVKGKTLQDLFLEVQTANKTLQQFVSAKYVEMSLLLPSPFPWVFAPFDELMEWKIIEPISQGKKPTDDITLAINTAMKMQKELRRLIGFEVDVQTESIYPFKKPTKPKDFKKDSENRTQSIGEHLSSLFEIALVLLGILSATETQYFIKVWGDVVAIRLSAAPFILMISVWLIKELFKRKIPIEFWLLFSEFCWELWSMTLTFYLLFLWLVQIPTFPQIAILESLSFGLIMYFVVVLAHWFEYKTVVRYYKSPKWLFVRLVFIIIGLLFIYSTFLIILKTN